MSPEDHLNRLIERYPALAVCREDVQALYEAIAAAYDNGGKLLVAGNGGSASDADHIVGEILKGFGLKRELPDEVKEQLKSADPERGEDLGNKLQGSLPAIALSAQSGIMTAVVNDIGGDYIFAQQVMGYGTEKDVLLLISTSGNSEDLLCAAAAARVKGTAVLGLSGESGGKLRDKCDRLVRVPSVQTAEIQELHLPVYHCLCLMLEARFFGA